MRDVCARLETVPRRDPPKGSLRFYADAARYLFDPWPYAIAKYESAAYARRLESLLHARRYDLVVRPDLVAAAFTGTVRIECEVVTATDELVLHARDLAVTGRVIDAVEAHRLGIGRHLCANTAELNRTAKAVLDDVLKGEPKALATAKRLVMTCAMTEIKAVLDDAAERLIHGFYVHEASPIDLVHSSYLRNYSPEAIAEIQARAQNARNPAEAVTDERLQASALITRGLAEVTRLGVALGGRAETFMGLRAWVI